MSISILSIIKVKTLNLISWSHKSHEYVFILYNEEVYNEQI